MEYNTLQHQDQTNSEALCNQDSTHMNDTTSVSRFKEKTEKKKKKDWPTDPPNFQAKRANKRFIFLGLMQKNFE